MNPSDLYTCSTAAAKLGVTPTRVRALIAAQNLRATLVGHVWLIEPAALDAVRSRKSGRPPSKTKAAIEAQPSKTSVAVEGTRVHLEHNTATKVWRHWLD
jgi:excisionase family DNA binding protein